MHHLTIKCKLWIQFFCNRMLMYDNYFSVIVARIKKSLFFYENSFSSMSFSIFKIANIIPVVFQIKCQLWIKFFCNRMQWLTRPGVRNIKQFFTKILYKKDQKRKSSSKKQNANEWQFFLILDTLYHLTSWLSYLLSFIFKESLPCPSCLETDKTKYFRLRQYDAIWLIALLFVRSGQVFTRQTNDHLRLSSCRS